MSSQIPVLFDTDIGSDIDDAVALAYLLKQPRCELLGITTVSGDVQKRAALAEIVCRAAGRSDVPIHCGKRDVLVYGPGQPNVPQYDAVAHQAHRLDRPENTAVQFLRDTIRSRPGEIVLIGVGPMSNSALLLAEDPEIASLCKSIVCMVGRFLSEPFEEWNAICDPVATGLFYGQKRPRCLSVGLDVTLSCRMPAAEVRRRFASQPLATVLSLAEKWFEHTDAITFHDPLAATLVFRPELCTYREGTVDVELTRGVPARTRFTERAGKDRIAATVDVEAFFAEYFSVF